jgi:hypothetical protein
MTLLLLFSLPLIVPLFALSPDADLYVPVCCRRNGAHHCLMVKREASAAPGVSVSTVPQHCPAYPAVVTPLRHSDLGLHTASLIFGELLSHPAVKPQTLARARVAVTRSRRQRGPPAQLL